MERVAVHGGSSCQPEAFPQEGAAIPFRGHEAVFEMKEDPVIYGKRRKRNKR